MFVNNAIITKSVKILKYKQQTLHIELTNMIFNFMNCRHIWFNKVRKKQLIQLICVREMYMQGI